ncbi:F-box protein [Plectosphaerella plurivora]|uniref:F-box protein n=1 Tax=Plectosphaerella plurivora TaxID=936078 RepID=A0A9P9AEK9_9PEZI|nr:F-box protein [Plectosphaerella plurivora]
MTINQGGHSSGLSLDATPDSHSQLPDSQITDGKQNASDEAIGTTHPLGVLPLGNQYLSSTPTARLFSGTLQLLPDEMLAVLVEYLDVHTLRQLGYTCKFLFAFTYATDFWKACFLEQHGDGKFPGQWRGTWRRTLLGLSAEQEAKIDCSNVYSDVLHRPFVCSRVDLAQFVEGIPSANEIRRFENLTYDEFAESWTEQPFVLTKCIQDWPVYGDWTISTILERFRNVEFRAEAVDWPFSTYHDYLHNTNDESPLYLFDKRFAEKMGITVGRHEGAAYWRPDCFGPDLFEVLGEERPAHRWLIIGPERSGSTFHKDPNATSAWNAVLQGTKYWIMFPPTAAVPGVYVSRDSSEVTSPLSIAEWLLEFHAEARRLPECVEGTCNVGEILHVPSGWWHLVVNLESGIALTQNFVPQSPSLYHLTEALSFLRDKADQVTGFGREIADPYGLFVERLRESRPELLEEALKMLEERGAQKKRKWEDAVGGADAQSSGGGFSFGFGGDDLDDDEVP